MRKTMLLYYVAANALLVVGLWHTIVHRHVNFSKTLFFIYRIYLPIQFEFETMIKNYEIKIKETLTLQVKPT